MTRIIIFIVLSLLLVKALAQQGIKGKVLDKKNAAVPFVTIYNKELQKGTNSNEDGTFLLTLPEGKHSLHFQSVGYKTQEVEVAVEAGKYARVDIFLEEQSYQLKEVNIQNRDVNPAVFIMRKAIAAAPYYRRQVLMYDAKVYVKGSGKLDNIPFIFEKAMKKDGIAEGQTFLTESINEVSFKQPNTYKERVVSVKTSLPFDGMPEPMRMARGSMYNTSNTDLISPLSPQAFSVYDFFLEGSFYDNGKEVNKIKVIPKRKGQDVYKGFIYIIEGLWCIHSTDLETTSSNFDLHIITSFRPVNGYHYVWLPVTYDIQVKGSILGFKGSFRYLASVGSYQIKLNPNVDHSWVQNMTKQPAKVEEKPEPETEAEKPKPKTKRQQQIDELLKKPELTKMEMLKLANKMKLESEEKEETLEIPPDSSTMEIDSLADKRDSAFWSNNRTVALMDNEVVSYKIADTTKIQKQKDTTHHDETSHFDWMSILTGDSLTFNKSKNSFYWSGLNQDGEVFVNTVDGWGLSMMYRFGSIRPSRKEWSFAQRVRIPFERNALNTMAFLEYRYAPKKLGSMMLYGGSYISDFNPERGASSLAGVLMLIADNRNLLKLFQQDFAGIKHQIEITNGLNWITDIGWYNRYELSNISRYRNQETTDSKITPNTPLPYYHMPTHQAFIVKSSLSYTPRQRYRFINGIKYNYPSAWPTITASGTQAIAGISKSETDYLSASLQLHFERKLRHWIKLSLHSEHQFFVYQNKAYFPDFLQASGNRSPIISGNPFTLFRQLDYYAYANTNRLSTLHGEINMKRLLLKRLPVINITNIHEHIFYNALLLPSNNHYQEIGYGLNSIFAVFRVDGFAGFYNGKYNNWGIRVVVSSINGR